MTPAENTRWVVERAHALGFDLCGVAPAEKFPELENLPEWLDRGYAGEMRYLHDPRRESPDRVLTGARSIIVCALNYNTPFPYSVDAAGLSLTPTTYDLQPAVWISRYAWGDDYHEILGEKLEALLAGMRENFRKPFEARAYVDTGPIVERVAAKWAGLGWLGKNTCLINEELGSWLFLGVIITTLDLTPSLALEDVLADSPAAAPAPRAPSLTPSASSSLHATPYSLHPAPDLCGHCTQCIDACPTGALVEPYVLDARRCISYLTIELRGPIPEEFHKAMGWHIFGCDICQDVCPYNRNVTVTSEPRFLPRKLEIGNSKSAAVNWRTEKGNRKRENGNVKTNGEDQNLRTENSGFAAANVMATGSEHPASPSGDSVESSDSLMSVQSVESVKSVDTLFNPPLDWLLSLSEHDFRALFRSSAIRRTKHSGLLRNAKIVQSNAASRESKAPDEQCPPGA